jgi:hypothetical protein
LMEWSHSQGEPALDAMDGHGCQGFGCTGMGFACVGQQREGGVKPRSVASRSRRWNRLPIAMWHRRMREG